MKQHRNSRGYTLPELLITAGIVSIVLSTAVPGISTTIKNNRLATHINSLMADIHLARSEAVKRDTRIILCRSGNVHVTVPTCGGDAQVWSSGYVVFADDGNYTNDVYDAGTDVLLRIGRDAANGVNLRTNSTWNRNLQFNPDGTTNEGGALATMSICDDRGKSEGRQIQVSPNGIPKLFAKNIATCFP